MLDEIVEYDGHGECVFHLEMMSDGSCWMRFYRGGGGKNLIVNFFTRGNLKVTAERE